MASLEELRKRYPSLGGYVPPKLAERYPSLAQRPATEQPLQFPSEAPPPAPPLPAPSGGPVPGPGLSPQAQAPAPPVVPPSFGNVQAGGSGPFDPQGGGYDFETALKYGIQPDETGHWPSRAPNGQILKGTNHPTFGKTLEGEAAQGYEITQGPDGRLYSQPKGANFGNMTAGGSGGKWVPNPQQQPPPPVEVAIPPGAQPGGAVADAIRGARSFGGKIGSEAMDDLRGFGRAVSQNAPGLMESMGGALQAGGAAIGQAGPAGPAQGAPLPYSPFGGQDPRHVAAAALSDATRAVTGPVGDALGTAGRWWSGAADKTRAKIAEVFGEEKRPLLQRMQEDPVSTLAQLGAENAHSLAVSLGATMLGGPALGIPAMFAQEAGGAFTEAKQGGANDEQALEAAGAYGIGAAILEYLPVARLLKKSGAGEALRPLWQRTVREAVKQFGAESSTEVAQELTQKAVALATWAGDQKLTAEDWKEFTSPQMQEQLWTAGLAGGVLGGVSGGVKGAQAQPPTPAKPGPAPQAPKDARSTIPIPTTPGPREPGRVYRTGEAEPPPMDLSQEPPPKKYPPPEIRYEPELWGGQERRATPRAEPPPAPTTALEEGPVNPLSPEDSALYENNTRRLYSQAMSEGATDAELDKLLWKRERARIMVEELGPEMLGDIQNYRRSRTIDVTPEPAAEALPPKALPPIEVLESLNRKFSEAYSHVGPNQSAPPTRSVSLSAEERQALSDLGVEPTGKDKWGPTYDTGDAYTVVFEASGRKAKADELFADMRAKREAREAAAVQEPVAAPEPIPTSAPKTEQAPVEVAPVAAPAPEPAPALEQPPWPGGKRPSGEYNLLVNRQGEVREVPRGYQREKLEAIVTVSETGAPTVERGVLTRRMRAAIREHVDSEAFKREMGPRKPAAPAPEYGKEWQREMIARARAISEEMGLPAPTKVLMRELGLESGVAIQLHDRMVKDKAGETPPLDLIEQVPDLRRRYDEAQKEVDRIEDELYPRLRQEGQDPSMLFEPYDPQSQVLRGAPGWAPMPDDLAAAYRRRNRLQEREKAVFRREMDRRLEPLESDEKLRGELAEKLLSAADHHTQDKWKNIGVATQAVIRHITDKRGERASFYVETELPSREELGGTLPEKIQRRMRVVAERGSEPSQATLDEAQRWMDELFPEQGAVIPGATRQQARANLPSQVKDTGIGQEGSIRLGRPQRPGKATVLDDFQDQELAEQLREATIGKREPGLLRKTVDWVKETAGLFARERRFIPTGKEHARFAPAREILRHAEAQVGVQGERTARELAAVLDPLTDAQNQNLSVALAWDHLRNLAETKGPEFALPFGITTEALDAEQAAVDKAAADPYVQQAVERHREMFQSARDELRDAYESVGRDASWLDAEGDQYLHHQILELMDRTKGKPRAKVTLSEGGKPGFARFRKGSEKAINLNYAQAQGAVIYGMRIEAARVKARAKILAKYDAKQWLADDAPVPEGYEIVTSDDPHYFPADSLVTSVAEAIRQQGGQMVDPSHLRQLKAVGKRKQWIIPSELAAQLREENRLAVDSASEQRKINQTAVQAWKRLKLHSPRTIFKYLLRNQISDQAKVASFNPGTVKKLKAAMKDIAAHLAGKETSEDFKKWFNLGGWNGTQFSQEVELSAKKRQQRALSEATQLSDEVLSAPADLVRWWFRKSGNAAATLESINRYATFLSYKEQIENGGEPENWGASIPEEIKELDSIDEQAYWLSNELVGAYDMVSVAGRYLRKGWVPFWSFSELNARSHYRLLRNEGSAFDNMPAGVKAKAKKVLQKSPFMAAQAGRFVARAAQLELMLLAWNKVINDEDEEKLPEDVRQRTHIVIPWPGKDPVYFDRVGNFSELTEWLGGSEFVAGIHDYLQGKRSIPEVAEDMLDQSLSKIVNSLAPIAKSAYEAVSGVSTFPSVLEPRTIRDRAENIARFFSVDAEFRAVSRKLSKHRDDVVARPDREGSYFRTIKSLFVYEQRIGAPQYQDVLSARFKLQHHTGGGDGGIKSRALRAARRSIALGDRESAIANFYIYQQNGGTVKDANTSLRNMHPLQGLKEPQIEQLRKRFGQETLDAAVRYYEDVVLPDKEWGKEVWEAAQKRGEDQE